MNPHETMLCRLHEIIKSGDDIRNEKFYGIELTTLSALVDGIRQQDDSELVENAVTAAIQHIQNALGVKTGDYAGVFFSNLKASEDFQDALLKYIKGEREFIAKGYYKDTVGERIAKTFRQEVEKSVQHRSTLAKWNKIWSIPVDCEKGKRVLSLLEIMNDQAGFEFQDPESRRLLVGAYANEILITCE